MASHQPPHKIKGPLGRLVSGGSDPFFRQQQQPTTTKLIPAALVWRPSLEKKIFNTAIAGGIKDGYSQDPCWSVCKISFEGKVEFVKVGSWKKAEGQGSNLEDRRLEYFWLRE